MVEFHGLTMKMWLFILAQCYVFWEIIIANRRLTRAATIVMLSFLTLVSLGISIGLIAGAGADAIVEDIKPLIYMSCLIFLELTICSEWHLRLVLSIIKACSLVIAVLYIALIGSLLIGFFSFSSLYAMLSNRGADDFMFRGDQGAFFYKGSIYLAVGMILFAFERGWRSIAAISILGVALLATGTRGFFLGVGIVMLAHLALSRRSLVRKICYFSVTALSAVLVWFWFATLAVDRSDSDFQRIDTIHQVLERISPASLFVGHGFGVGVPEKPVHMEVAYLEIFHKQGLVGLTWWGGLLALFWVRYRRAKRIGNPHAQSLFLCGLFVGVVSSTNPFINNPIGMLICLVAITGLSPRLFSVDRPDIANAILE